MSYMEFYVGKDVLVTGGTGSIGSTIVKQLIEAKANITVLSRDESKQASLWIDRGRPSNLRFEIGDVRDIDTVHKAVRKKDVVIHAAAMKHVDKCNEFPAEAIRTNIIGSMNVQSASVQAKVGTCIVISTDKAAGAIGALGHTKRLSELIFLNEYSGITEAKIVRFGNVLGSRGSVAQIFKQQIDSGQLLTVTNPDMFRFFMTPKDAADLVLWSGSFSPNRSISTKVLRSAMVRDLVVAFGVSMDSVKIIGEKAGEKNSEQLLDDDEFDRLQIYDRADIGAVAVIYPEGNSGIDVAKAKTRLSLEHNHMTVSELRRMLIESGVVKE